MKMKIHDKMIQFPIKHPKSVVIVMVIMTLILGGLMTRVKVDTDPENMLSETEAVRVFHHQVKKEFSLHDVVVLGIVNETDPDGVFNPGTLKRVYELTRFAMNLADPKDKTRRVVTEYVIAPGTVDTIEQAGLGQVRFEWLMQNPPKTREEAKKIRDSAMSNPLLRGTMVSEDGKALAIYLPITHKDFAYQVRKKLLEKIATFKGNDKFYITGLPVAEDTFGVEMFVQMAISAPVAMLFIFLLMLFFFKNIRLIISPMIIAMVSVICTMGLLIGTGNTVHIMSSMIPIFIMPIAVVDSIHILSEFFDRYQMTKDRVKTIEFVMDDLFMPMLYTSLTSAAGFASLAVTPIPPVQVFGLFVAFGIMLAWVLTIIFTPAYIMLLNEKTLENFGAASAHPSAGEDKGAMAKFLNWLGGFTYVKAKLVIMGSIIALAIAGYGISLIQINDNPVKWFKKSHPIRIADKVLNAHFGGTYEAYLVIEGKDKKAGLKSLAADVKKEVADYMKDKNPQIARKAMELVDQAASKEKSTDGFFNTLSSLWEKQTDNAPDEDYDIWADAMDIIDKVKNRDQIFKRPDVLNYIARLQKYLAKLDVVGKSNSLTDVVKKVHQELFEGKKEYFTVPGTINGIAQCLISFQNSHKPYDLWHLVTPDYKKLNIWVQLKNGDNKDMEATIKSVEKFFAENPPPVPMIHKWAGLTYLNVVWQNRMVKGMLNSFLSSFAIVLIMMIILFRSLIWGILAMIPLSVTIALIYGIIGYIGKDYDMPVAVLSSLTLGLAVDFAIHFLERTRSTYKKTGSWARANKEMFQEPARAITRNVIVIAIGFTPLLLAPLIPYQTVGVFLASIMAISGVGTIFILPALVTVLETAILGEFCKRRIYKEIREKL